MSPPLEKPSGSCLPMLHRPRNNLHTGISTIFSCESKTQGVSTCGL